MAQVSIFVSHSHQDNEWCRSFVSALKAVGYDIWYDETGLTGGAAWVESIQREVQSRDIFLMVLTPEAWASQWVQDELQLAIATRRRILPVLLRNCQVDGFLLTTQWVTAIGDEPQVAARSAIIAVEAPPAPGRTTAPQAEAETLSDLLTLCRSLLAERRFTEALSASGRALALDPTNAEAFRLRGKVLSEIDEPYKAAETWGRALSLAVPEHVAQWAPDIGNSLLNHAHHQNPAHYDREVLGYLKAMIPQLSSGDALYAVFEMGQSDFVKLARVIADTIADTSLLPAVFAVAKRRGKMHIIWELATCCYGNPPKKATAADVDGLRYFKEACDAAKGGKMCEVIQSYITRLSG